LQTKRVGVFLYSGSHKTPVDQCRDLAIKSGHNTFALQEGTQCWTGKDVFYAAYGKQLDSKKCGPGGGKSTMQVYTFTLPTPKPATKATAAAKAAKAAQAQDKKAATKSAKQAAAAKLAWQKKKQQADRLTERFQTAKEEEWEREEMEEAEHRAAKARDDADIAYDKYKSAHKRASQLAAIAKLTNTQRQLVAKQLQARKAQKEARRGQLNKRRAAFLRATDQADKSTIAANKQQKRRTLRTPAQARQIDKDKDETLAKPVTRSVKANEYEYDE